MQAELKGTIQHNGKPSHAGWWDFGLVALILLTLIGLTALGELIPILRFLRLMPGFFFVLFIPGYCLIAALFPCIDDLDGIERAGLSLGLSVAVMSLLVLPLDALPGGISLWPTLLGECLLTITFIILAAWRRLRLPACEAYLRPLSFHPFVRMRSISSLEWTIYGVLLIALLFGGVAVVSAFHTPSEAEFMTEFYILDQQGMAVDIPYEIPAGQTLTVTTGVTNREQTRATYAIVVKSGDQTLTLIKPFSLAKGESWEGPLTFNIPSLEKKQTIEILLARDGQPFPYRSLRLLVDVLPNP